MDAADRAQDTLDRAMRRFETRKQARPSPARLEPVCHDCGDWIPDGRLRLYPFALRCAECQGYYDEAIARD